jgi:hypothetical protein
LRDAGVVVAAHQEAAAIKVTFARGAGAYTALLGVLETVARLAREDSLQPRLTIVLVVAHRLKGLRHGPWLHTAVVGGVADEAA